MTSSDPLRSEPARHVQNLQPLELPGFASLQVSHPETPRWSWITETQQTCALAVPVCTAWNPLAEAGTQFIRTCIWQLDSHIFVFLLSQIRYFQQNNNYHEIMNYHLTLCIQEHTYCVSYPWMKHRTEENRTFTIITCLQSRAHHTQQNDLPLTSSSRRLHPCTAFWSRPDLRWAGWMSRGQSQDTSRRHAHQRWCWPYAGHHCQQSNEMTHINISPWNLPRVIPPSQSNIIIRQLTLAEPFLQRSHPFEGCVYTSHPRCLVALWSLSPVTQVKVSVYQVNHNQWCSLWGCYTTHLSFADDEERVSTSTLPNDVITRCVECLQKETHFFMMPEEDKRRVMLGVWANVTVQSTVCDTLDLCAGCTVRLMVRHDADFAWIMIMVLRTLPT